LDGDGVWLALKELGEAPIERLSVSLRTVELRADSSEGGFGHPGERTVFTLRAPSDSSCSARSKLHENREVGVKLHTLQTTDPQRRECPFVLGSAERALDGRGGGTAGNPVL
jgi:hypothetical protein